MPNSNDKAALNARQDALLIGVATGLRSATPIAAIARSARSGSLVLPRPFSYVGDGRIAALLTAGRHGEHLADKLPITPSRLELRSLVVRAVSGAVGGAMVAVASGQPWSRGVLPGAVGAIAGSFAGYEARMRLSQVAEGAAGRRGVPAGAARFAVAALEDAASMGLSVLALRNAKRAAGVLQTAASQD